MPKVGCLAERNDYRLVALTSHLMKTLERLLLHFQRPRVAHSLDPLQFAYQEEVDVDDAVLYSSTTFIHTFEDHVPRPLNTIQPLIL